LLLIDCWRCEKLLSSVGVEAPEPVVSVVVVVVVDERDAPNAVGGGIAKAAGGTPSLASRGPAEMSCGWAELAWSRC
jgi:hypothetical protein